MRKNKKVEETPKDIEKEVVVKETPKNIEKEVEVFVETPTEVIEKPVEVKNLEDEKALYSGNHMDPYEVQYAKINKG